MVLALSPSVQNGSRAGRTITMALPGRKQLTWNPDTGFALIDGTLYRVTEFAADGGRGFRFAKTASFPDAYEVFIANGQERLENLCDCKGFVSYGKCKHVEAAQAIADLGIVTPVVPKKPANTARDLANDAAYRW